MGEGAQKWSTLLCWVLGAGGQRVDEGAQEGSVLLCWSTTSQTTGAVASGGEAGSGGAQGCGGLRASHHGEGARVW